MAKAIADGEKSEILAVPPGSRMVQSIHNTSSENYFKQFIKMKLDDLLSKLKQDASNPQLFVCNEDNAFLELKFKNQTIELKIKTAATLPEFEFTGSFISEEDCYINSFGHSTEELPLGVNPFNVVEMIKKHLTKHPKFIELIKSDEYTQWQSDQNQVLKELLGKYFIPLESDNWVIEKNAVDSLRDGGYIKLESEGGGLNLVITMIEENQWQLLLTRSLNGSKIFEFRVEIDEFDCLSSCYLKSEGNEAELDLLFPVLDTFLFSNTPVANLLSGALEPKL